jgi:uncharacterized protein (TIGR03067 family)
MLLRNLLLLLGCLLWACGEAAADDAADQQKLEGSWSFVSSSGGKQNKQQATDMRVVFKGDTISFVPKDDKRTLRGSYSVDSSKSPKTMEIILDYGGKKATTLAIYELDGETLKLCHYLGAKASQQRPKEFMADTQIVLGVLKRAAE